MIHSNGMTSQFVSIQIENASTIPHIRSAHLYNHGNKLGDQASRRKGAAAENKHGGRRMCCEMNTL